MPRNTARKGEQTPTRSFVLPYSKTEGASAIRLYQTTGRKAQEWQKLLIYDMLAVNEDGLWMHTKFGYSFPRRNGKYSNPHPPGEDDNRKEFMRN